MMRGFPSSLRCGAGRGGQRATAPEGSGCAVSDDAQRWDVAWDGRMDGVVTLPGKALGLESALARWVGEVRLTDKIIRARKLWKILRGELVAGFLFSTQY
jgi:hypothetical protein